MNKFYAIICSTLTVESHFSQGIKMTDINDAAKKTLEKENKQDPNMVNSDNESTNSAPPLAPVDDQSRDLGDSTENSKSLNDDDTAAQDSQQNNITNNTNKSETSNKPLSGDDIWELLKALNEINSLLLEKITKTKGAGKIDAAKATAKNIYGTLGQAKSMAQTAYAKLSTLATSAIDAIQTRATEKTTSSPAAVPMRSPNDTQNPTISAENVIKQVNAATLTNTPSAQPPRAMPASATTKDSSSLDQHDSDPAPAPKSP